MSINIQAATAHKAVATRRAQALPSPETRELERKWRRWTRNAIAHATQRQVMRGADGVPVTMTSDSLMAKLRAADYRCALSGVEFRADSFGRFGPTVPTVDRIDADGPYSNNNTRVVCRGVNSLRGRGSMADMYRLASGLLEHRMSS